MKYFSLSLLILIFLLAACSPSPSAQETNIPRKMIVAASSPVPHGAILEEVVKPLLAEQGIDLDVKVIVGGEVNDYLVQKQIDANFFQHIPYLDAYNLDHHTELVNIAGVHIEPFGAYSNRHKTLADLPEGAEIVIPSDPSNHSRALLLLDREKLITVNDPKNPLTQLHDIIENPKHLKIREMDAAMMVRVLDQVDLALINSNYVLSAGMNPAQDALAIENADSIYVNILVVRPENKDDPSIHALAQALTSPQVKSFIEQNYPGAVLPAF